MALITKCKPEFFDRKIGQQTRTGNDLNPSQQATPTRALMAVMIGSDRFETDGEQKRNQIDSVPSLNVGDNTIITHAILDKDCRIGSNVTILNNANRMEYDEPNGLWHIRDGIVCVPRGAVIPNGTVI